MSDFEERPKFYLSIGKAEWIELVDGHSMDKSDNTINNHQGNSRILVDLLRLITNYSDKKVSGRKRKSLKNDIKSKEDYKFPFFFNSLMRNKV